MADNPIPTPEIPDAESSLESIRANPRKPTRLQHSVDKLGRAILEGGYAPGRTLPTEAELSRQLGVGRGTLREAVKILSSKGLLDVAPRRGTIVTESSRWHMLDPDVIRWAVPHPSMLQHLNTFRHAIEPEAAARAAQNVSRRQAAELLATLEAMELSKPGSTEATSADLDFHRQVLEATHNPFFASMVPAFTALLNVSFQSVVNSQEEYDKNMKMHERIAEAICDGESEQARQATLQLLSKHVQDQALSDPNTDLQ